MQALNIEAASKHAVDLVSNFAPLSGGGTSTPLSLNTPDILNSLISITSNPFFGSSAPSNQASTAISAATTSAQNSASGDEDKKVFATLEVSTGSSVASNPAGNGSVTGNTPVPSTVQSLRSQFIKDSLKLTIQTKRKSSGKEVLDVQADLQEKVKIREEVDVTDTNSSHFQFRSVKNSVETPNKLTPEDEERRRRRRERNKIAATKCRNKKKEKTGLLVLESQTLERTNVSLKSEISKLEQQRQRLAEILAAHAPLCLMKKGAPGRVQVSYNRSLDVPSNPSAFYQLQQTTPARHHISVQRS